MFIATCICGLVFSAPAPDKIEIKFKYLRPSKVAEMYKMQEKRSRLGALEPDDFKGTLTVWGATEDLERFEEMWAKFDVPSKQVSLRFKLSNSVHKISYEGTAIVPNNLSFNFADNESNAKVTHNPRIMDDGLIHNYVSVEIEEAKFQSVKRVKPGVQFVLKIQEMIPVNDKAKVALKSKDERLWPVLSLSADLVRSRR